MTHDSHLAQRAALIAALCAAGLAIAKLILFFITGSLIIGMSAWDSSMDVIVSLMNRKIVQFARTDADDDHPYGHGRAESIAAFGQGSLILGGGAVILISSFKHIASHWKNPVQEAPIQDWRYVIFFLAATAVSVFITKWLYSHGKKLHSPALLADSQHYKVDSVTNIASAVAIAAVIVFKQPLLDPCVAFFFAIYIIYGAVGLLRTSIDELMDRDISEEVKKEVTVLIHSTDAQIIDVHKLRGRKCGPTYYFDCHVTLPQDLSFQEVHDLLQKAEHAVEKKYGGDTIIHADPLRS